jgi:membrane protein
MTFLKYDGSIQSSNFEYAVNEGKIGRHRPSQRKEMTVKNIWILIKAAASSWADDYAQSMGAALAYYTLFSIAPLLLIVISIAGLIFGVDAARGEIVGQLEGLMGQQGAQAVQGLLESVNKPAEGITATAIGGILLLVGATTVFAELQDALDRIWRAPKRDKGGLWSLLRARLLSFGMIMGIGFLLMVSLVVSAALAALSKMWGPMFEDWEVLAQVLNFVVSFAFTTTVFAMIYKIMPRVKVDWTDVWVGAVVTALLFTIGKFLIGLYIGKSGVTSGFGAAGSLVVVLVWVYYSAQIFLMGAEFTWAYAHSFGSRKEHPLPAAAPAVPTQAGKGQPDKNMVEAKQAAQHELQQATNREAAGKRAP